MEVLFKLLIYVASVWISNQYAAGYWVVGPVFGLAVVTYDSNTFRNLILGKHAAFLAASTLIYALVYWISLGKWGGDSDFFNYFAGPFPAAVVTGSVLLPLSHAVLFRKSGAQASRAILALVASFYTVTLITFLNDKTGQRIPLNFLAVSIAVWQGVYLYIFFGSRAAPATPR